MVSGNGQGGVKGNKRPGVGRKKHEERLKGAKRNGIQEAGEEIQ